MITRFPRGFTHPMRIGIGAFASVYRVRQAALDRWVALKFIYDKIGTKRRGLIKEAQTQAKMHAECVPQIFDAFEWRQSVCMVMEWIRGVSLAILLERPLSSGERVAIADKVIHALATIHRLGFAHRDMKPENVIITPEGELFLVDFGFSKQVTTDMKASSITTAKGTPEYMAPELWKYGSQVDLMRADVYATGKVLSQVLASTPHVAIARTMLADDPLKRPASGKDVLTLWKEDRTLFHSTTEWYRIVGDVLAVHLSQNLLSAAKTLLYSRRGEEAYWLLVESLEENGNNREALDLMTTLQKQSRKKIGILHYLLFALILMGGVGLAFIAGVQSNDTGSVVVSMLRKNRPVLLSSGSYEKTGEMVSLRTDSLITDKLSGRLIIRNIPESTRLFIDSKRSNSDSVLLPGCLLHCGTHTVTLTDSAGAMLVSRTVKLLPFQSLAIDMNE